MDNINLERVNMTEFLTRPGHTKFNQEKRNEIDVNTTTKQRKMRSYRKVKRKSAGYDENYNNWQTNDLNYAIKDIRNTTTNNADNFYDDRPQAYTDFSLPLVESRANKYLKQTEGYYAPAYNEEVNHREDPVIANRRRRGVEAYTHLKTITNEPQVNGDRRYEEPLMTNNDVLIKHQGLNRDLQTELDTEVSSIFDGIDASRYNLHDFMFTLFEKRMKNIWPQPASEHFCRTCNYKQFRCQADLKQHQLTTNHERLERQYEKCFCLVCQLHCISEVGMEVHILSETHIKNQELMESIKLEGISFWHAAQSRYFLQQLRYGKKQMTSFERCTQTKDSDFPQKLKSIPTLDDLRKDIYEKAQLFYELGGSGDAQDLGL